MFVVVGARDFSPEITMLPIGPEVPCSDRVPHKFQFIGQIGASSKMLLMFLLLTKSLGHV